MTKAWLLLALVVVIGGGAACSASKNPIVRLAGGIVFGLLSLGFTALTGFLFHVGVRNHWSSDGPGMLFVMIAIAVFGFVALAGWRFTLGLIFGGKQGP
jgi:hypothetical protein